MKASSRDLAVIGGLCVKKKKSPGTKLGACNSGTKGPKRGSWFRVTDGNPRLQ